jgi:hypothetical protein
MPNLLDQAVNSCKKLRREQANRVFSERLVELPQPAAR